MTETRRERNRGQKHYQENEPPTKHQRIWSRETHDHTLGSLSAELLAERANSSLGSENKINPVPLEPKIKEVIDY